MRCRGCEASPLRGVRWRQRGVALGEYDLCGACHDTYGERGERGWMPNDTRPAADREFVAVHTPRAGDFALEREFRPELVLSLEALRETASPTLSPEPTRTPTPSPTSAPSASLAPTTAASRVVLDADTIFEVVGSDGEPAYFRNLASTVRIGTGGGNASASFEFRNPPHFVSFTGVEMTARDAAHETEAVLDPGADRQV